MHFVQNFGALSGHPQFSAYATTHIARGISVSLLDTIVTYATESDRAQNSLQNDVL